MNRPDVYERSVSVLIKAFLNDTLEQGDCDRCAVGALCADADAPLEVDLRSWEDDWHGCRRLVEATGYAPEELARIEHAFEEAADPYRGLLAVFEVLQAIHETEELCETTR